MRLETGNQFYDGFEQLVEVNHECPVDTEYSLPDYCADIQKILKCIVTPQVHTSAIIGDTLTAEGVVDIHVLYLDAEGECVRGFDTKKEFTFTVRLNSSADGAAVKIRPAVQHINCRALNARRVDIHIAVNFAVSVSVPRHIPITEQLNCENTEVRRTDTEISRAVCCKEHSFILEENMSLQSGKPPAETVLRRSVKYRIENAEVRSGEVVFSGYAYAEILYRGFSETALPERMLFELPFTQTVECAGAEEGCTADISVIGGVCAVQPREDEVGEYAVINIYLKPVVSVRVYKADVVSPVCDAYAVNGELSAKYKNVSMEYLQQETPRTVKLHETVRIPEADMERVLDIWCEGLSLSAFAERDNAVIRGKLTLCILYRSKEKHIVYTERLLDFTDTHPVSAAGKYSAEGDITGLRFSITDAAVLECTAEVRITAWVRTVNTVRILEYAELDENAPDIGCNAAVYYACRGESVWDIAKRYRARLEAVVKHNGLTGETLEADRPVIVCRK